MNIIERTEWAKEFKRENPHQYETALKLVTDPNLTVDVYQSDETGSLLWVAEALIDGNPTCFWLFGNTSKQKVNNVCKKMRWEVV